MVCNCFSGQIWLVIFVTVVDQMKVVALGVDKVLNYILGGIENPREDIIPDIIVACAVQGPDVARPIIAFDYASNEIRGRDKTQPTYKKCSFFH